MYAISKNKRKHSPTPIVEIIKDENGNESEKVIFISTLSKKEGNEISKKVVNILNELTNGSN